MSESSKTHNNQREREIAPNSVNSAYTLELANIQETVDKTGPITGSLISEGDEGSGAQVRTVCVVTKCLDPQTHTTNKPQTVNRAYSSELADTYETG